MRTKYISLIVFIGLFLVFSTALATTGVDRVPAVNDKSGVGVIIPEKAVEVADGVFSLGAAVDPGSGKLVEGYAFVYKDLPAKPDNPGKPGGKDKGSSKCYAFLANGAKWKEVKPWVVNATNDGGLADGYVLDNLAYDIGKWEIAAETDILGNGVLTSDILEADTVSPDGVNEVYFADIDSQGAIGITIVWGIFGGRPAGRELVEWDQVYDDVDYGWSSTGEAGKMDFENIATHELGHTVGMGHPTDSCMEETMYRFAGLGETIKRDLGAGDIAGIGKLY